FKQSLLGTLEDEPQPMEVVHTTAPPQRFLELALDELAHHFPIPVGQVDSHLAWRRLDGGLQLSLFRRVEGGGGPPVCSKPIPLGPASPNVASHWPIVWGSRSNAAPT